MNKDTISKTDIDPTKYLMEFNYARVSINERREWLAGLLTDVTDSAKITQGNYKSHLSLLTCIVNSDLVL